jgi:hypothetical protein
VTLMCLIGGHAPEKEQTWNEGYFFSRCRRCSQSLIRTSGRWLATPSGYQVAWKSGRHRHAIPSDFRRNLPLLGGKPWRWLRGFRPLALGTICLPGTLASDGRSEDSNNRPGERGLPDILLLGLFTLLGFASRPAARPIRAGMLRSGA